MQKFIDVRFFVLDFSVCSYARVAYGLGECAEASHAVKILREASEPIKVSKIENVIRHDQ